MGLLGILLGVNIDHVATVRNARGTAYPDPIEAALLAEAYGADGITAHLREDRRHMTEADMFGLKARIKTRLNMEMANTPEMLAIALALKPAMVTLVPERRQELTTEGGLDVMTHQASLKQSVEALQSAGIPVSLFVDPDVKQIQAARQTGSQLIELHTGSYCEAFEASHEYQTELNALSEATRYAVELGLIVNAGHGLHYYNLPPLLAIPLMRQHLNELNIGHSLIAEAIFTGLGPAVTRMKALLQN